MEFSYLGEVYNVVNGADALSMLQRIAADVTGLVGDAVKIGNDVAINAARIDRQSQALQWIGGRLQAPAAVIADASASALPLVLLASSGGLGGLGRAPAPSIPPIAQPTPAGLQPGQSPHRNPQTPPVVSGVNPALSNVTMGPNPTDRTHSFVMTVPNNIAPGTILFTVTFGGGAYLNVPNVLVQEISFINGGITPANLQTTSYVISSQQVLQGGEAYAFTVTVFPTTESFD